MLDFAETKVFVVPKLFRGFDHEAMAKSLKPQPAEAPHVVVVDGEGPDSFEASCSPAGERLPPPRAGEHQARFRRTKWPC